MIMICDFHTHTTLSDGVLSPLELIHRAFRAGYRCIAITDHAGIGQLERFITEITQDCRLAEKYWNITAIPGVELTYVPTPAIADVAKQAKDMGARIVIVHGETTIEPVEHGTNMAAVTCSNVDILAHPGMITLEEASLAKENGVFLEITSRPGHALTNEHVAKSAVAAGAKLLLNSDSHTENDLLSKNLADNILRNSSLSDSAIRKILQINPDILLDKIR